MHFDGNSRQCMRCEFINQIYDPEQRKCVDCPNINDYFDPETNECKSCGGNHYFDSKSKPGKCKACPYKN